MPLYILYHIITSDEIDLTCYLFYPSIFFCIATPRFPLNEVIAYTFVAIPLFCFEFLDEMAGVGVLVFGGWGAG